MDLTRFLTELGKVGNYSVGTARVARTWEVLVPNKTSFELAHRRAVGEIVAKPAGLLVIRIHNREWRVAAGEPGSHLFAKERRMVRPRHPNRLRPHQVRMRYRRRSATRLNDAKGVQLWLDQQPVDVAKEMKLQLTPELIR